MQMTLTLVQLQKTQASLNLKIIHDNMNLIDLWLKTILSIMYHRPAFSMSTILKKNVIIFVYTINKDYLNVKVYYVF